MQGKSPIPNGMINYRNITLAKVLGQAVVQRQVLRLGQQVVPWE